MSSIASGLSQLSTVSSVSWKGHIFHDPPIISSQVRLNIIELKNSDKQVANELIYRCCRILTRVKTTDTICRVFIIDTIASMSPVRLATILKRDSTRLRQIQIARQSRINSTYVTLCANFKYVDKETALPPKLYVIYHDEFYIMKTLNLLKEVMNRSPKTQFILLVPELDRLSKDALNLMPANQILRCDFEISRKDIAPAPPDSQSDSYSKYLNQVTFRRHSRINGRFETLDGELTEDGLHLFNSSIVKTRPVPKDDSVTRNDDLNHQCKRQRTSQDNSSSSSASIKTESAR